MLGVQVDSGHRAAAATVISGIAGRLGGSVPFVFVRGVEVSWEVADGQARNTYIKAE